MMINIRTKKHFPVLIFTIAVVVIIGLIVVGMIRLQQESFIVTDKCSLTNLYVIGDKGHRNRVYDCSGINLN